MPMMQKTLAEVLTVARASAGTVFDAAGNLVTVPANQPRFDYDPVTRAFRGLLVEEQRTNSIRNSQGVGAVPGVLGSVGALPTTWSSAAISGVTREVVATGAENGIPYVDVRFFGTPAVARWWFEFLASWPTVTPGQDWAASVFIRRIAGTGLLVRLLIDGFTSANAWVEGSVYLIPDGVLNQQQLPRVSVSGKIVSASVEQVRHKLQFDTTVGQPIDVTFRIALPQLEQGAFPTSPIITTTAAATRAADVVQVIDGLWRGNSAHTLYVESSRRQIQPAGTISCAAALRQLPSGGIYIESGQTQPSANRLRVSAVGWAELANIQTAADAVPDRVYRHAITVSAGRAAYVRDGALVGTAAPTELPPVNALHIGSSGAGNYLNGHIRQVQYADRVLSDADLIAVSLKGLAA